MIGDLLNAATLALFAAGAVAMIYGLCLWFSPDSDRKAKPKRKRKRGDLSRPVFARRLIWLSADTLYMTYFLWLLDWISVFWHRYHDPFGTCIFYLVFEGVPGVFWFVVRIESTRQEPKEIKTVCLGRLVQPFAASLSEQLVIMLLVITGPFLAIGLILWQWIILLNTDTVEQAP